MATDHEISHGRAITWTLRAKQAPEHIREAWIGTSWIGTSWTVEVVASGTRDSKPFQATHLFLTSLRTTPEALLQLVRDRWSIEGWHWIRCKPSANGGASLDAISPPGGKRRWESRSSSVTNSPGP